MKKLLGILLFLVLASPVYGAAVTSLGSTWDTNAGTKTVTGTPAIGDLIIIVHGMSDWVSGDDSTAQDNAGGTYTRFGTATVPLSNGGGTAGALWISVRNEFITSASSTNFQAVNTGDTGGGLTVFKVTGMYRTGANAVRQTIGESTQTENPPTVTFGATTLTENPIILATFGEDNPAGVTAPAGFTGVTNAGWATPTSGVKVDRVDSGQTATLFSWSGGALTDHNEVGIELDTTNPQRCLLVGVC